MTFPIAGEQDARCARRALRGAVLRDAARLVEARDVLVVVAASVTRAHLLEALVCGEHSESSLPLDLRREPLLLRAATGGGVLRCCPRRPRRVVGPYWSTAATLVPVPRPAGTIVVFAGGTAQPPDPVAREAAALARPGGWADELERGPEPGHAVVVARGAWLAGVPSVLRRLRVALGAAAPAGTQAVHLAGAELCVLVPSSDPPTCGRVAGLVRRALDACAPVTGRVAVGWAIGMPGEPPARAVEVARAMAHHEERRSRPPSAVAISAPAGRSDDGGGR